MFQVLDQLQMSEDVNLHLVEISPTLAQKQEALLCRESSGVSNENALHYKEGRTKTDVPVYWYSRIQDVPKGFSCFIAHEFFDALPIHQFKVGILFFAKL